MRRFAIKERRVVSPTGARAHALSVWNRSRVATGSDHLAFIGTLAAHVIDCPVCPKTWIEGDRPVDHLERWLRLSPVRDIWQAAG